jgi:hypothetical protein
VYALPVRGIGKTARPGPGCGTWTVQARHELLLRTHAQRKYCGAVQKVDAELAGTAQRVRVKVGGRGHGRGKYVDPLRMLRETFRGLHSRLLYRA